MKEHNIPTDRISLEEGSLADAERTPELFQSMFRNWFDSLPRELIEPMKEKGFNRLEVIDTLLKEAYQGVFK